MQNILLGLNVASAVAAIIGAGVLLAAAGFALWVTDVLVTFFDAPDDWSDDSPDDAIYAQDVASGCELECASCGSLIGSDLAVAALADGSCPSCGDEI